MVPDELQTEVCQLRNVTNQHVLLLAAMFGEWARHHDLEMLEFGCRNTDSLCFSWFSNEACQSKAMCNLSKFLSSDTRRVEAFKSICSKLVTVCWGGRKSTFAKEEKKRACELLCYTSLQYFCKSTTQSC